MADEAAKNAGGDGEPKGRNEETPADWEMLSASSISIGDLKSGSLEQSGADEGVSIAAMHSQYFGQAAPAAAASSGEIISQDTPKAADTALPDTVAEDPPPDVIESELVAEPATTQQEKFRGPEFGEVQAKAVTAVVTDEKVVVPASVQPAKDPAARPSLLKRLQNVKKHLKSGNSVYAAALVTVVVGLVIIGRRWHLERLKNMELELQNSLKEDKINQLLSASDISSISNLEAAPAAPASTPRSFFGSLRDLF